LGGVQELSRNLAAFLVAAGDEVEVWWQQDDGVDCVTTEILDGLIVRRFPFPLPNSRPESWRSFVVGLARTTRELQKAVREFRPDLLHVHCFGPNGVYATLLSRLTRIPLVVTLHGETLMDDQDIFEHSMILRTALRVGLKQASAVTACSQFTLQDARSRFGLRSDKGEVIFNGVILDSHSESEPEVSVTLKMTESVNIDGRYVLALGRVVEKKGFDLLIRAFARAKDAHPDVVLAIGGAGPSLSDLRKLSEELGIADRVQLLGRLSRSDVAARMEHAEIFVMPSRVEPFGIVILEAWRAGRALISTSRGGPPEFVTDGQTGLLVDPFDTSALAAALDRLLSDPAYGESLGRAGQRSVENFDWSRIGERYQQVYSEVKR
jgi:glycogen(starch) synthase